MSGQSRADPAPLVEHFFRHEAGRLVAVLTRVFGWRHADLVEDTVQAALLQALQAWRVHGAPADPAAWLHRVAKNKALDALRRRETARRAAPDWARRRAGAESGSLDDAFVETRLADSQLRVMFACCHPQLKRPDQIALTLKTLCGFGVDEIARALLIQQEAVKKRLLRARQQLQAAQVELEVPAQADLLPRLAVVHQVLYLMFNEGYSTSHGEQPIREDLCEEAARLCHLLANHPQCGTPGTLALLALMLFHAARLTSRKSAEGRLLLLQDQDREQWDRGLIDVARHYLDRAAAGTTISRYHLEAGICLEHCLAARFAETNWPVILRLYDALVHLYPSPVYLLNRAIVVAQLDGPQAGIAALVDSAAQEPLARWHLWDATLGELHRRAGDLVTARRYLLSALDKTASPADQDLLRRRLAQCDPDTAY